MFRSTLGARRGWTAGAAEERIASGQEDADARRAAPTPAGLGRLTRRQLLKRAGGIAGLAAIGGAALGASRLVDDDSGAIVASAGSARVFRSRPDLHPPAVAVTGGNAAPGYLFLAPKASGGSQPGPLLVDHHGDPVWFKPLASGQWATNVSVAHYRGEPVMIWWEGNVASGYGEGEGVIVDSSYRELARVRAGNGRQVDLHEFRLTPEGTALFTCHPATVRVDLSPIGGPRDADVLESIIQEVDVQSGRVLLEWRSLEHIPVSESYQSPGNIYDYLHANSIDITPDGNLLVSGRHTWALYKLERRTGRVIWRLGGMRSDFQMGKGTQFAWQHDARQPADDLITVFDNGDGPQKTEPQSRGLKLEVDSARKTVRLARAYQHPQPLQAESMGSLQMLPDGHALVGWGAVPGVSEFAANGKLLADARLSSGHQSYRAYRFPWTGSPKDAPAIATTRDATTGNSTVHVSWNGATAISHWQLRMGPSATRLRPLGIAERRGFETAIPLGTRTGYVAATALSASGRQLGSTPAVRL